MNRGTMGVNSLPKTVTRQRRACDLWTQALLRMSPSWVRFLVYNTGLVQYRWTGLDLLTADRLKMQDWKIANSSKYSSSCCTYVFHLCRCVLAFSTLAYSYLRIPYLHIPSSGTFVFRTCVFSRPVLRFLLKKANDELLRPDHEKCSLAIGCTVW